MRYLEDLKEKDGFFGVTEMELLEYNTKWVNNGAVPLEGGHYF